MNRLKNLLKSIGVIVGLWLALTVITLASAQAAHAVAVTIALAAFVALLRPMPKLGIGSRAFATVLLLIVGLPISMATQGLVVEQRETRLAGLKLTDSAAYLAELQTLDEERWLSELVQMNPEQHSIELARVNARRDEEREVAAKKVEEQRLQACGEKNEVAAYVMSQSYIRSQLKSPSTAKFPYITAVQSKAVGDCMFRINAYVDAQNSFGATLRTRYTALMRHTPSTNSWVPVELSMAN